MPLARTSESSGEVARGREKLGDGREVLKLRPQRRAKRHTRVQGNDMGVGSPWLGENLEVLVWGRRDVGKSSLCSLSNAIQTLFQEMGKDFGGL